MRWRVEGPTTTGVTLSPRRMIIILGLIHLPMALYATTTTTLDVSQSDDIILTVCRLDSFVGVAVVTWEKEVSLFDFLFRTVVRQYSSFSAIIIAKRPEAIVLWMDGDIILNATYYT